MASITQVSSYVTIAAQTAMDITSGWEKWTAFLKTAARLYRYSFTDQLLIHAQNPDATACAEFETYKKMRWFVKRGSKGIALVDVQNGRRPDLRYVFDIKDTGRNRNSYNLYLWEYKEEHQDIVTKSLEKRYDVSGKEGILLQIAHIATQTAKDYWKNYKEEIRFESAGSLLEELDDHAKNLPDVLFGTPWMYCPIAEFSEMIQKPLLVLLFLYAYLEHPCLEHLVKTGFNKLVSGLAYDYGRSCLDETQHRTHRILGIAAEDVEFLRGIDPDMNTLRTYQGYAGLKGRQELLLWQLEHKVSRDIMPILKHMTPHKFMRYMDTQFSFLQLRRTPGGSIKYKDMEAIVTEYRDCIYICEKLNYDLKNSFVLFPKDLQKAHDKAAKHQKQKVNAKLRRDFNAAYSRIKGQLDFEHNGLKIIYPNSPNAVISEGHELHHCVGSYVDRIARQDCVILFLRQCSELSKPFFTIEIRDRKIVQVRGMKNCDVTPEVEGFIKAWERRVLSRLDTAA